MADIIRVGESQVPSAFVSVVRDVLGPSGSTDDVEYYLSDGTPIAILIRRDADDRPISIKPLGCPLCIRPRISRDADGSMLIRGRRAVPFSAVGGDDEPRSPLRSMLAFCPDCGGPVVDPGASRAPVRGEVRGFRDE